MAPKKAKAKVAAAVGQAKASAAGSDERSLKKGFLVGGMFIAGLSMTLYGLLSEERQDSSRFALDVTFTNPSSKPVSLLKLGASSPAVAFLEPGASSTLRALEGERFAFDSGDGSQQHVVRVDKGWTSYHYNVGCQNLHDEQTCLRFAKNGECQKNPGWMFVNCAVACEGCHLLDPKARCDAARLNISTQAHVKPGGIGEMFSSLQNRFPQYNVSILSQPPVGPWIVTFDNFITQEEADAVQSTTESSLQRSTDQGAIDHKTGIQQQVVSQHRTSSNAWCWERNGCSTHPLVKKLVKKIANVVQVPTGNFEKMQVLRYDKNQYYHAHHDASDKGNWMLSGHRLYTFFLYFNSVEEGGGTQFPDLNITVPPAKFRALLWPHLLDEDPEKIDGRTRHAALPVIRGTKLAANVWVHQKNYEVPNLWGCTGAFA